MRNDDEEQRRQAICDAKAEPDAGNYPQHWTAQQCVSAYWESRRMDIIPDSPAAWEAVERHRQRRKQHHTRPPVDDEEIPF